MSCSTCAATNQILNEPFQDRSAVSQAAVQQALAVANMYANCAIEGKVLAFGIDNISVLAAADGLTSKTNSDPAAGAIDFLEILPFSKQSVKLHGLIFETQTAADLSDISVGQIQLEEGRDIRPRIKGSFSNQLTPATSLQCDDGLYKCGVDVLNSACLRSGTFQDPIQVLLANSTAVDIAGVSITVLVEYFNSPTQTN